MFMENKDVESWSSTPIYQSQWLQTTISGFSLPLSLTTHALLGVTFLLHVPCYIFLTSYWHSLTWLYE